ncbi:hypothetical protein MSAN_00182900 [Mycena sanguinolenta]|uniref:F-box domain-containing protein n=1 Tax=Mycena sanguinolenta TaxID=230812 RepID=A0A8H6ZJM9_9AGAR|nr:hypothetical protein MSAN_00182900 [Mycena sanguinolenta]
MSSPKAALVESPAPCLAENQVKGLIAAAEANIERLTVQIHELSLAREKERSVLAALRSMLVPIGKLPTELFVEIFKLVTVLDACFDPKYYSSENARTALRSVLSLSQVSSYWRQIVHNSPQLWALEGFIRTCVDRESDVQYLDGLEVLLARSNPVPVSVALVESGKNPGYRELSKTIARIVTPTAHRWKRLSIGLPSLLPQFNQIPPETFEALEDLFLCGFQEQMDPIVAFQSCPRLLNFGFECYSEAPKAHLLHLPWSQIVHLEITLLSLLDCRTVLLQCGNLVSAEVRAYDRGDSVPTAGGPVVATLPFLSKLDLTICGRAWPSNELHSVGAFLAPLALPSLKVFDVDFEDGESASWPTQVITLFQGRCPNIEQITLFSSSISSEGLTALLRNAPALTTLDLISCLHCIDEHFWHALRYDVADACPLVPKLRNLRLEYVGDKFTDGSMEAAIRSRWWPSDGVSAVSPSRISRLKRVSVSRFGEDTWIEGLQVFSKEFEAQMQDMVDQGLSLELW